jgi:hypothetical protein
MSFVRIKPLITGRSVSFPRWRTVLAASRLSADQRWRFATEIRRFLKYCRILNTPVNRSRAREYLAIVPLVSSRPDARQALRWFFQMAQAARHRRSITPTKRSWRSSQIGQPMVTLADEWLVPPQIGSATAENQDAAHDYP